MLCVVLLDVRFWKCFWFLISTGPYSLNGYRVRVYRQDSATQWFTGIITHHDLFSRNMVVMNDQVSHLILCFSSEKLLSAFSSVLLLLRSGNFIIKKNTNYDCIIMFYWIIVLWKCDFIKQMHYYYSPIKHYFKQIQKLVITFIIKLKMNVLICNKCTDSVYRY